MHNMSIAQLQEGLRSKTFSSRELTQHFLSRISTLNPKLNALITVAEESALKEADMADIFIQNGSAKELCGIPILHKDIFCTEGVLTTCGSQMLSNFVPPYSATVVKNFEDTGAVMLGKTNMDEFAMGSSNETSFYGPVKNPWNTKKVPGGSSGGSAAAVAARLAPGATGSDTGGSIRQPAAICGVSGLKPTYGRVSRWGMIAFASSLDQGGPIARTAEDCAIMLNCMAGYDPFDSTSVNKEVANYCASLNDSIKGLRVGLPKQYFSSGLNAEVERTIQVALENLVDLGAELVEVNLPHSHLSVPAYYVIAPAEASANLSRFDGVRYGFRCEDPVDLNDLYCRTRGEAFGEEVKRRILIGTYCLSAGYYDAYYLKAQKARQLIQGDFAASLEKVDLIAGPTCPSPAFEFGSKGDDPVAMYLEDIYTIATNLAGLPGMSIPCGLVGGDPVGLQLIGNYFEESKILNVAHQFQKITSWHDARPTGLSL